MKDLKCHRCSCYLGEIECKGKLKKGSVVICSGCFDTYKLLEDLSNYARGTKNPDFGTKNFDMPDGFKDLFGMK